MHGNEAEDAGLAYGALMVCVSPDQSRYQVGQFGTEVVSRREGCDLGEIGEDGRGRESNSFLHI